MSIWVQTSSMFIKSQRKLCMPVILWLGRQGQWISMDNLEKTAISRFSEIPCRKTEVERFWGRHITWTSDLQKHTYTHKNTCMYTHLCIYATHKHTHNKCRPTNVCCLIYTNYVARIPAFYFSSFRQQWMRVKRQCWSERGSWNYIKGFVCVFS